MNVDDKANNVAAREFCEPQVWQEEDGASAKEKDRLHLGKASK